MNWLVRRSTAERWIADWKKLLDEANAAIREKDALINSLMTANSMLLQQGDAHAKRYDDLMERFTTLRLAGAVEPPPPMPVPPKPDQFEEALDKAMIGMPYDVQNAARMQLQEDRALLAAGLLTDEQLLTRIRRGTKTTGIPE